MQFSEKLNYLFKITHAEGKALADTMNITAPQISKMRNGSRGMPKDRETSRLLTLFFAKRCNSDFQKDMLAKTIGMAQIRSIENESILADVIYEWLTDEKKPNDHAVKRANDFLLQFGNVINTNSAVMSNEDTRNVLTLSNGNFMAYYGNEGKRLAAEVFFNLIEKRGEAYVVDVLTDENMSWLYEDQAFSKQFQKKLLDLTERGCSFRRISGPIMDIDQAFESLSRWFPLYMTGKATAYYYKRMRDSLNRISLFVVPGVAVLFSFSVGNAIMRDRVTFFTTDVRTVTIMAREFEYYLSMCEPIMKVYAAGDDKVRMHECMLEYDRNRGNSLQQNSGLSFITLPWDIAKTLHSDSSAAKEKSDFLTSFAARYKCFQQNIEEFSFTDLIRLADLEKVMEGKVVIPGAYVLSKKPQYYTPKDYLRHVRNVLYLMERRPNYHAVLRTDEDATIIYVKEGYNAILTLDTTPFSVFEVSERYLVDAFAEYVRRKATGGQEEEENRREVIQTLKRYIRELDERIQKL